MKGRQSMKSSISSIASGKRILRVRIESIDVPDDYYIKTGVKEEIGKFIEFETDLIEMTFRQYAPLSSWTTIFTDGALGKIKPVRAFFMWATEMLLNVLAIQDDPGVRAFLTETFHKSEKVKTDTIHGMAVAKSMGENVHQVNYRYRHHIKANGSYPFSMC